MLLAAAYYCSSVAVRPEHYQHLINNGWRRLVVDSQSIYAVAVVLKFKLRSGTLYYKQNLLRSCCPYYTLRYISISFSAAALLLSLTSM